MLGGVSGTECRDGEDEFPCRSVQFSSFCHAVSV